MVPSASTALAELFTSSHSRLVSALSMTFPRQDAEDAVQAVFESLVKHPPSATNGYTTPSYTWLLRRCLWQAHTTLRTREYTHHAGGYVHDKQSESVEVLAEGYIDIVDQGSTENAAIARLYLEALAEAKPKLLSDLRELEACLDRGVSHGPRGNNHVDPEYRALWARVKRARTNLEATLDVHIIRKYFGHERGNDLAENR